MAEQKITHNTFSISEAIRFGWQVAKKNVWFFVAMLLINQGISLLTSYIYQPLLDNQDVLIKILGVITFIVGWIINLEIEFAMLAIYLKFVDRKHAVLKDLFVYFNVKLLIRYFLIQFLYGLGTLIGVLLFIIPGIYFATKYWFAGYIYVDKRTGVIESFKESANLTKGIKWQLFRLGLLQLLIEIGGMLALLVGLFIAIPINYLSDFYIYRKISKTLK